MAQLQWDVVGERTYEHGVNHGVLFVMDDTGSYKDGVAWSGLTSVSESPEGGEINDHYADNIKYLSLTSAESLKLSVEAFTYPKEFKECDGSKALGTGVNAGQQTRKSFGFSYATVKGNDTMGDDYSELIHLVYGCKAAPSERQYQTISDSPEPITFSWEFTASSVEVGEGFRPTSVITIDTRELGEAGTKKLKDQLYGTDSKPAKLPTPKELITLLGLSSTPSPKPGVGG